MGRPPPSAVTGLSASLLACQKGTSVFWQTDAVRLAGESIGSRQPSEAAACVAVQERSVMEMGGGGDGREAVIPVSNPAAGTQRSPVLKGLPKLPPPVVQHPGRSGLHARRSGPRVPLSADTEIESYVLKVITALNTKRFISATRAAYTPKIFMEKHSCKPTTSFRRDEALHVPLAAPSDR